MNTLLLLAGLLSLFMVLHNGLYPLILKLLATFSVNADRGGGKGSVRFVSVIIPAYNEALHIVEKLENLRSAVERLRIPCEVIVGSDGSDDGTAEKVRSYINEHGLSGWRVVEYENEGKCLTINKLFRLCKGDLIVSTDADVSFEAVALERIVRAFEKDARLGCLTSVPVFRGNDMKIQKMYWKFEIALREQESRTGKLIVTTGALYAYRAKLFREIPPATMADDLWIPLNVLFQKHKVLQEKEVRVYLEETDEKTEVKRRKRVISGGIDVVARLLGEIRNDRLLLFIVFSHKINRWLLPFWLALLALSTSLLEPRLFFLYLFLAICMMFLLGPKRFASLAQSVLSPVAAVRKNLLKKDLSKWKHTRK